MARFNWFVVAGLTAACLAPLAYGQARPDGCAPEEVGKLSSPDPDATLFGQDIDVDGDRMVVGVSPLGLEAVQIYERQGGEFVYVETIFDPGMEPESGFGRSVDLYGDTLIVGAPLAFNEFDHAGKTYIYKLIGGQWELVKTLGSDSPEVEEQFGTSVSGYAQVGWEAVVVGARNDGPISQGSVYVFQPDGGGDLVLAEKLEGDVTFGQFGTSVDVCGPWLIAGAPVVAGVGYANIYESDGNGNWTLEATFSGTFEREFGSDVAIGIGPQGEVAAIGEPLGELDNGFPAGRVYLLLLDGAEWEVTVELADPSLTPGDRFGWAFDFNDTFDRLAIGAPNFEESMFDEGKAYLYQRNDAGQFVEIAQVEASDAQSGDMFGFSIAVDDDTLVVGAPFDDSDDGMDTGAAYVFALNCGDGDDCYADFDGNGMLNVLDFIAFQNAFANADPNADCDASGTLNILDFICFADAFGMGC